MIQEFDSVADKKTNLHQPKKRSSANDKERHLRICLKEDVESAQTNGFERFYLINDPAPEINFEDIDLSTEFIGKEISAPFVILPMTGGTRLSAKINQNLAVAAQDLGVAMSVGSQRVGLEDPTMKATYQVRGVAPDIPLLANLGAVYLNYGYGIKECEEAVEMIGADGLCLYLNPMQKIFQGNGSLNFKGVIQKIEDICSHLRVPVIVKEVGFGLSSEVAMSLEKAGAKILDIAGAGGTSWVKVSRYMKDDSIGKIPSPFDGWGIPTADSLTSVRRAVKGIPIIASGGIRNGIDMAKALALGADYIGMALPLLAPAMDSPEAVKTKINGVIEELKIAMFGCGVKRLYQLRDRDCIREKVDPDVA